MFVLNDDERVIVETAAAFAGKRLAPHALEWDAAKHFPVDVLREAAELGMAAIYCRDDVGGSGLRRLDGVRIFEQLAIADPVTAAFLSIHNMCAWMIDSFGTDEQRKDWIPRLATMGVIASYCLTEPGAGSDAGALSTRAVRHGSGKGGDYVLDGVKQFISGAAASDVYVVMARTGAEGPRGVSAFIVEKGTPGLSFGAPEAKMGWHAQPTAQVVLDGVRVPAEAMLGGADGEGAGFGIAMSGLNGGRLNIAACSLGGAQAAFDKAGAYVRDRQAFGGSLLDEPTVRFTLADMATGLQTSRILLWRAASALDDATPTRSSCVRWPSATSPTPALRSPTRPCSCTAAMAICASMVWRRSSATCGCIASWKGPTRSCGWSSVGPRPRGSAPPFREAQMTTIAFLGLGNMGAPMSANLVGAGHVVRGFDPAPTAASGAAAHGVAVFRSAPEAVAEADVVITMLPTGEVVRRCYTDVLAAARPATLFIDSSTISVTDAREVHALAESHGMLQLDAPVSGGVKGAAAATLAFMVGGDESTLRRARPVLEPMAGKIIHCGAAGAGQAAKVCNNMVLAVQQIAIAEAFVLAEKLGLSAQSLFDVITGATGNCWAVHTNCPVPGPVPTSPANNDFKPGFSTALMNKDLGLAMDAVAATGATAPLGSHAADIYAKFAADHADLDFSAVIHTLRARADA